MFKMLNFGTSPEHDSGDVAGVDTSDLLDKIRKYCPRRFAGLFKSIIVIVEVEVALGVELHYAGLEQ